MGWREWIALPQLGVTTIKAKIDTGARSSAIHAFDVETFWKDEKHWVRFQMHPLQRNTSKTITAEAEILDEREVRNSGGHSEKRITILTTVQLSEKQWPIELTLTNRDVMGFRMLLGRAAVRGSFLVNPGQSYLLSQKPTNLEESELEEDDELEFES